MSLLSNTFSYVNFFFPDQIERKELFKDARITGSGVVCFIHDVTTILRACVSPGGPVYGKYLLPEGMNRDGKRLLGKKKKGVTGRSPGLK